LSLAILNALTVKTNINRWLLTEEFQR